jgi:hypothetical protein
MPSYGEYLKVDDLLALLEESTRGDPCSPLMWTTLSLRDIAAGLAADADHRLQMADW